MSDKLKDLLADLFGDGPQRAGDQPDLNSQIRIAMEKYEKDEEEGSVTEIDPDIRELYDGMTPHAKLMILKGDIRNAQRVLFNIADLVPEDEFLMLFGKKQKLSDAWHLLVEVFSRSMIMEPDEIVESLSTGNRHRDLSKETLTACITESLGFLYAHDPAKKQRLLFSIESERMVNRSAAKNRDLEDCHLEDPDYGLVPQKPVFVHGFGPHRKYLDRLLTSDGREISYDRRGSMIVDGIDGPVDIYDLSLPGGEKYMTIYLCLYGSKNSDTAPKGLKFSR